MSTEKRVSLLETLKESNGTLQTDVLTLTSADAEILIKGHATADMPSYMLLAYDANQTEIVISEKFFAPTDDGSFYHLYHFDPTSLAVYQNAVSFRVRVMPPASGTEFNVSKLELVEYEQSADNVAPIAEPRKIRGPKELKNVLFVGNSILLGIENRYGLCASAPDRDYAYHVSEEIKKHSPACQFHKVHGSAIEHSESVDDFEAAFYTTPNIHTNRPFVESLTPDLDLIILQITDNVNTEKKVETFYTTAELLLKRIRERCPHAVILWAHGWYYKKPLYPFLTDLLSRYDVESVDLHPIRFRANEAPHGATYLSADGTVKTAKDLWISHPGDSGMAAIASLMIQALRDTKLI